MLYIQLTCGLHKKMMLISMAYISYIKHIRKQTPPSTTNATITGHLNLDTR